ncbi:MAG TPA: hypothetical protein PKE04_06650, partial [Clostridia bacterium]|nr:hypothetical protein [Clostridia bacterium]
MNWTECYSEDQRPRMAEIMAYLNPEAAALFQRFNLELGKRFGLGYVLPTYSKEHGWKYQYGRSGFLLMRNVLFRDRCFWVEGVAVTDEASYQEAVRAVEALLKDGFEERFEAFCAKRTEARKHKESARKAAAAPETSKAEKAHLNRCQWPAMVSRAKLLALYDSDQKGMPDEALLDEIGITFAVRCKEAKRIYELMERGAVQCTRCGRVLEYAPQVDCACGESYTYREYRRSFRANNMPRGEASGIFDRFVLQW